LHAGDPLDRSCDSSGAVLVEGRPSLTHVLCCSASLLTILQLDVPLDDRESSLHAGDPLDRSCDSSGVVLVEGRPSLTHVLCWPTSPSTILQLDVPLDDGDSSLHADDPFDPSCDSSGAMLVEGCPSLTHVLCCTTSPLTTLQLDVPLDDRDSSLHAGDPLDRSCDSSGAVLVEGRPSLTHVLCCSASLLTILQLDVPLDDRESSLHAGDPLDRSCDSSGVVLVEGRPSLTHVLCWPTSPSTILQLDVSLDDGNSSLHADDPLDPSCDSSGAMLVEGRPSLTHVLCCSTSRLTIATIALKAATSSTHPTTGIQSGIKSVGQTP